LARCVAPAALLHTGPSGFKTAETTTSIASVCWQVAYCRLQYHCRAQERKTTAATANIRTCQLCQANTTCSAQAYLAEAPQMFKPTGIVCMLSLQIIVAVTAIRVDVRLGALYALLAAGESPAGGLPFCRMSRRFHASTTHPMLSRSQHC
jgi:hypothetical protein